MYDLSMDEGLGYTHLRMWFRENRPLIADKTG